MYWVRTPWWLKKLYPGNLIWDLPSPDTVYLSFDDGPHPEVTDFVLRQLAEYGAKGSFFCVGQNVERYPELYRRILEEGHLAANHTQHHLNGWKTTAEAYLSDFSEAARLIAAPAFRPPYGRITREQIKGLRVLQPGLKIYMWGVLSGDFDAQIDGERCWRNVERAIRPGSIVVFHDSVKAFDRLKVALPRTLQLCKERKWKLACLPA